MSRPPMPSSSTSAPSQPATPVGGASSSPSSRQTLVDVLGAEMEQWRADGLERTLRPTWGRDGATVMTDTGRAIDFASNDYLGLAADPRLARAAIDVLHGEGVGATASRLIVGHRPQHQRLEEEVAAFFGAESALTFSTGYAANAGIIPALVGSDDLILSDALNHASLIDGCRLSRATVRVYPHRDIGALRSTLESERHRFRRAMIVTDGVFSMDGDRAPLPELVAVARTFDAWSYVDDAHGVGVVGANGRGSAELAGVEGSVDITVGTFGKAFGGAGAFVLGARVLIDHLLNRARSFVFSTAPIPAQAAAAIEALRIVRDEPERRLRLRANAAALRDRLRAANVATVGDDDAHIIPVIVGDARQTIRMSARLRDQGILVGAVRPPTVPHGSSRLRISISAAHTLEQLDALSAALANA